MFVLEACYTCMRIVSLHFRAFAWLRAVQRSDLILNPSKLNNLRICSAHFTREMYNNNAGDYVHSRLLPSAIPSLSIVDIRYVVSTKRNADVKSNIDIGCQTERTLLRDKMTQVESIVHSRTISTQTPKNQSLHHLKQQVIKMRKQLRSKKCRTKEKRRKLRSTYLESMFCSLL